MTAKLSAVEIDLLNKTTDYGRDEIVARATDGVKNREDGVVRWNPLAWGGWPADIHDESMLQVDYYSYFNWDDYNEWLTLLVIEEHRWGTTPTELVSMSWDHLPRSDDRAREDFDAGWHDAVGETLAAAFHICESSDFPGRVQRGDVSEEWREWAGEKFAIPDRDRQFLPRGIIGYDRSFWLMVRNSRRFARAYLHTLGTAWTNKLKSEIEKAVTTGLPLQDLPDLPVSHEAKKILFDSLFWGFFGATDVLDVALSKRSTMQGPNVHPWDYPEWALDTMKEIHWLHNEMMRWIDERIAATNNCLEFVIRWGPRSCMDCGALVSQIGAFTHNPPTEFAIGTYGLACDDCKVKRGRGWFRQASEELRLRDRIVRDMTPNRRTMAEMLGDWPQLIEEGDTIPGERS